MTATTEHDAVIPAHPEWCAGPLGDAAHCSTDPYHRGDALHLEVQSYEVGFSVGLTQSDDHVGDGPGAPRDIGEPRLEFTMRNRETDDFACCMLNEDETARLIGLLQHSLSDLQNVRAAATSSLGNVRLGMTLGWTPSASD